jgi:hypothetical protein
MAIVSPTSQSPSLPDQYTLVSGDGTLCFNTSMRTLMVKNDHHQNVLSVTDDPEVNAVTVRELDPTTGRQKSMDVFGVSDGRQFHEIFGAIPTKETLGGIGPLGGPALPTSHESMSVGGYKIDIQDNRKPDTFLGLFADSAPKDRLSISVASDTSGTVSMSSVGGESNISTSYSPAPQGFDLFHPSSWLSWL